MMCPHLRQGVQEAQKRLKREEDISIQREPMQPLPTHPNDEREGMPPIDFNEVDELRRAFPEMQAHPGRHGRAEWVASSVAGRGTTAFSSCREMAISSFVCPC